MFARQLSVDCQLQIPGYVCLHRSTSQGILAFTMSSPGSPLVDTTVLTSPSSVTVVYNNWNRGYLYFEHRGFNPWWRPTSSFVILDYRTLDFRLFWIEYVKVDFRKLRNGMCMYTHAVSQY